MRFGGIGARLARFRKVGQRVIDTHHDALEFANGTIVLLTKLRVGQTAMVLQLPAKDKIDRKSSEKKCESVWGLDASLAPPIHR